jgi:outer membrane protein TolC
VKLGDNTLYSLGPSLSWLAWDHGGARDSYLSAQSAAQSKRYEADSLRRQLLLGGRIAYFSLLLSRVQTAVLNNAVSLAQSQYDDIKINVRAGAKSRMDEIAARQELLSRSKQLRQAQAEAAQAVIELSRATGRRFDADAPPVLDDVDELISQCRDCGARRLWADHPDIKAFDELSAAARYAQASFAAGLWPKVSLQARSSIEYPDQVKQESFVQNMVGVSFSWALFEGGFSRAKAAESELTAAAAHDRAAQARSDMQAVWDKAGAQLANLEDQKKLDEELVRGTGELAGMVFGAYKAGTVSYLQVEDANIKALEAKLSLARTNIQMLGQYATLSSLSEE